MEKKKESIEKEKIKRYGKKIDKKKIIFQRVLNLIALLSPLGFYYFLTIGRTGLPMLDTDGYNYIWFWNMLSSGKVLYMQSTVPKPLPILLYGMSATPNLLFIEIIKMFAAVFFGYGIFKLMMKLTENIGISLITEFLLFLMPPTILNLGFGNSVFLSASFIIWSIYFYLEERHWVASFLLFIAGLIRPSAWAMAFLFIVHYYYAEQKFLKSYLLVFLAPILWMISDYLLTSDPFYSYKVMHHYVQVSNLAPFTVHKLYPKWRNSFMGFLGKFGTILGIFAVLYTVIKRKRETLLILFAMIILALQITVAALRSQLFLGRFTYTIVLLTIPLIFWSLSDLLGELRYHLEVIAGLVIAVLIFHFTTLQRQRIFSVFDIEKIKQGTCRQMAPNVAAIDDRRIILPERRIGMFAYLNHRAYGENVISERKFIHERKKLTDIDYIVYIENDYVGAATVYLVPLLQKERTEIGNLVIARVYQTPNRIGRIYRVFKRE